MEFDEVVLSEVHFNTSNELSQTSRSGCKIFHSTLTLRLPKEVDDKKGNSVDRLAADSEASAKLDEDGDLIVTRDHLSCNMEVINIEHTLSSQLHLVGLQIWSGSLLLSDYILHKRQEFVNCIALELGAGVGLCSIIMARVAKTVFCTDKDESILATCETNSKRNSHLYKNRLPVETGQNQLDQAVVRVRELDWTKGLIFPGNTGVYNWTNDDQLILQECSVLLATDVVYDNKLTEAFFQTVHSLMRFPPVKILYVAVERRVNFTMSDLDISCAEYDFFIDCLQQLQQESFDDLVLFNVCQLTTDFPSFFHDVYKRTPYLELWKVGVSFK